MSRPQSMLTPTAITTLRKPRSYANSLLRTKQANREPAMPTLPSMDRSMLPSIMTKVSPRATTRGRAIWLRIFIIFLGERKLAPQTMRKTTTRQASTINGASFIIFALRFSLLMRSANSSVMVAAGFNFIIIVAPISL